MTVILIAHLPHAVSHKDKVLARRTRVQKFGPREDVLPTAPQVNRHQGTPTSRPSTSLEQAFAPQSKPAGGSPQASQAADQSIAGCGRFLRRASRDRVGGSPLRRRLRRAGASRRRIWEVVPGQQTCGRAGAGGSQVAGWTLCRNKIPCRDRSGCQAALEAGRHREPETNRTPVQPPDRGYGSALLSVGPQHVPSPPRRLRPRRTGRGLPMPQRVPPPASPPVPQAPRLLRRLRRPLPLRWRHRPAARPPRHRKKRPEDPRSSQRRRCRVDVQSIDWISARPVVRTARG